ncbi:S-norcoclaurine synthase 1 [Hibiscus syriacus]|uniref:S-norcoclaurine synthase 1 n=1 Tax=Hibiscus syriacus TaxID=106335 RepID=A0A6A3CEK3_HIBSY|nr:S-norcoclaurine synthase 1 [Hibiscus syriacus]
MEVKVQNTVQLEQIDYLPVENAQSLASKNLKNIPSRCIRPEVETDVVSTDESLLIPVIDMSKLDHEDEQKKLHIACKHWGFFQFINHGIANEVIEKMKTDAQEFFNLPLEGKMTCALLPNHIEGYGQVQVKEVEGLQLKRNQKWVPVKPIPGAFIINIGDILEFMSNGEYKSVVHRAVVNPEKERQSIASFHNQKMGTQIDPLQDIVETNKALYRTIPVEEFRRLKLTSKLEIYDK